MRELIYHIVKDQKMGGYPMKFIEKMNKCGPDVRREFVKKHQAELKPYLGYNRIIKLVKNKYFQTLSKYLFIKIKLLFTNILLYKNIKCHI